MTFVDIVNGVNDLLVAEWPDRAVYVDVCPAEFSRPSFWLHSIKPAQTVVSPFLVRHQLTMALTLFDETDEHYEVHASRLMEDEARVLELMQRPLAVGERRLTLAAKLDGRAPDEAAVILQCEYFDENHGTEEDQAERAKTLCLEHFLMGSGAGKGLPGLELSGTERRSEDGTA